MNTNHTSLIESGKVHYTHCKISMAEHFLHSPHSKRPYIVYINGNAESVIPDHQTGSYMNGILFFVHYDLHS